MTSGQGLNDSFTRLRVSRTFLMALLALLVVSACAKPVPPDLPTSASTPTPTTSPTPVPTPTATPRPTPPPVQVPRKEAAYQTSWAESDLRGFDAWGDSGGDQQDLVAVYLRQEGSLLRFRIDLLDLRAGQFPGIYLALDFAPGGTKALEPGGAETSDIFWDLLVKVSDGNTAEVFAADFSPVPKVAAEVKGDIALDYVTLDILQSALFSTLVVPFQIQFLAVTSGDTEVKDRTPPVQSDASPQGRARMVIRFGNLLGGGTPHGVSSWYDSLEADRDGQVKPKGWRYLLDAAEKYWVPMSVDVKQMQYLGWTSDLGLYGRVSTLYEAGLLELPDSLGYGHFMAWQPQDVDAKAIALSQRLARQVGLPASSIFSPYEGQITVADLQTVQEAGYESIIAGSEQDYHGWFGVPMEEALPAAGKLHRANGIGLIFQRYPWSFVWDPRWGDDPYRDWSEYSVWRGTDDGLHYWFRRNLLDLALSPDHEQFITLGTDIGVTPWGFQGVAEANLRWIVEHPWIQVIRESQLFHQGWTVTDHGDFGLPPDTLLPSRFPAQGDLHYNTYFSQFYYGGVSDGHSPLIPKGQQIESYAEYVPYWRDGLPIPSGRMMGDDQMPGTIIYETLRNLRSAPDNDLTTLAWLFYLTAIGEQTFHSTRNWTPQDIKSEDYWVVPIGGAYLDPAAKMRANTVRQVNKVLAAAQWADAVAKGQVSDKPAVEATDLDMDGEEEYVLRNNRLYLVFEDDGGRLEYAFAFLPGRGPVQFVAPHLPQFTSIFLGPSQWDWTRGEAG